MSFVVPKFIERKPKIVGALNLKQLFYVGVGVVASVYLYYTASFYVFVFLSIILISSGVFLAFYKIEGISITTAIGNFFFFFMSSKVYLWKKSGLPPKIIRRKIKEEDKKEKGTIVLDMAEKSKLKHLFEKTERY
jgi:hypothetical protein